jgi:iron(III) transport system substrate-binding protein
VNQYTRSGAAPARAAATGESLVGITFLHDAVTQALSGAPVKLVAPCEGTGYEIGSMSIIRGTRNMAAARKFYDWALTPAAQQLGEAARSYQIPSNKNSRIPDAAPKMQDITLIQYDFQRFGSSAERERLLNRWGREVRSGS